MKKQSEMPPVDLRVMAIVNTFGELIKDREFRRSLDALSEAVLQQCDEFFAAHAQTIVRHSPEASPADIVSAVVGWILGMPAGKAATTEARVHEAAQHNYIAAFISAWSAENSFRIHKVQ